MAYPTLDTDLHHVESKDELQKLISENDKVVVVCGRMGPMCVPVYGTMEILREKRPDIKFTDFLFDHPDAAVIRNLPQARDFRGLPFTIYYRNGKVVKATSSLQQPADINKAIAEAFS